MTDQLPVIDILGIPVVKASPSQALGAVERAAEEASPALVAYVNAHTLNLAHEDPEYRSLLAGAALVLNDGVGVGLAARMKGDRFPANLNGSDFNPRILELAARRAWPVFFLGAEPGIAEQAARRLRERVPGLVVAGTRDGYFSRSEDAAVANAIAASGAKVVMVAMGNPLQERWLVANLAATGARLGVGVGAFFDFAAEKVARAPAWLNNIGLEWVWRLVQEPGRLWRRYVVGNPVFLWRAARDAIKSRTR
ncbi:MAG: WecB/TagA/CpsF family glycosyltransferase [Actinomycetota bacterium]